MHMLMAISASWAFYARGRSTHPQTRNTAAALLNAGRVGAGVEAAVWALYTDTPPRPVHSVRKVATETLNSTEPSILQTHPLGMSIAQIKNMLESASLYTCARIHDLEKGPGSPAPGSRAHSQTSSPQHVSVHCRLPHVGPHHAERIQLVRIPHAQPLHLLLSHMAKCLGLRTRGTPCRADHT